MEGPITADCFGALVVTAGAAGAIGIGAIGIGATGIGAVPGIGSPCGRTVVGSSFRLFHTWVFPP
jgi:hypothetical protein